MLFREPEHGAIDGKRSRASRAESRAKVRPVRLWSLQHTPRGHPPPHCDGPRIWLDQPIKHLQQRRLTSPVMTNEAEALMPSPPGVRPLGCTKAFLRNLFFGPSQGPQFPSAKFEGDILDGEEFARTETVRGVERRASSVERRASSVERPEASSRESEEAMAEVESPASRGERLMS